MAFLGVDYETVEVDLMQDEQHKPPYLAVNPRGEVPALEDGDVLLRDSAAILVYVAAKHGAGVWWPSDYVEQARIVEWLAFAASWIQYGVFTARALASFGVPANGLPPTFTDNLEAAKLRGRRSLEILDEHLRTHEWPQTAPVKCHPSARAPRSLRAPGRPSPTSPCSPPSRPGSSVSESCPASFPSPAWMIPAIAGREGEEASTTGRVGRVAITIGLGL
jgi:hypothetical protein